MREAGFQRWLLWLALAFCQGAAAAGEGKEIKALRLWPSPDSTRAVFDVSGPLDYKLFELANMIQTRLNAQSPATAAQ